MNRLLPPDYNGPLFEYEVVDIDVYVCKKYYTILIYDSKQELIDYLCNETYRAYGNNEPKISSIINSENVSQILYDIQIVNDYHVTYINNDNYYDFSDDEHHHTFKAKIKI